MISSLGHRDRRASADAASGAAGAWPARSRRAHPRALRAAGRKLALGVVLALIAASAHAAEGPYDEHADARLALQRARAEAASSGTSVLVVFGANWCPDCRILDSTMKKEPTASLVAREFRVVKVDVGRFNRNVDVADGYGVPLKSGIPAIAIVSPANDVLFATRAGELADARKMGDAGLNAFFGRALAAVKPGS